MGATGRMIAGELQGLARPYVRCRLALPRLGIASEIDFLVDTGADATYLHPSEGSEIGIPFDLLQDHVTSSGIGGRAIYFPEPAVLLFADHADRQRYGYRINVNIAKPADVNGRLPSLLGRDVIRRWQMNYDPTNDTLEFTVRSADFTLEFEQT